MQYESRFAIGDYAMWQGSKVIIISVTFTFSKITYEIMTSEATKMYNIPSEWLTPLETQEAPHSGT